MEEDKETHEKNECGKKIKQQITIPFLWEEKPGAPKKDWRPKREPFTPLPLPEKYIASIPFKWEEKPGTPLPSFAQKLTQETVLENRSLPLPPAYFTKYDDECEIDEGDSLYGDDYDDDEQDWMTELDFEAMSVHSEDSFCSAPSLLANRLTPLRNPYIEHQSNGCMETAPFSPESNTGTNSYVTSNTSLRGSAFLAHMFPLYPPKSRFLEIGKNPEETRLPEKKPSILEEHKKLVGDGRRSGVIRRPCTLGELIMQSRRRSYRRKAVNMKKQYQQKVNLVIMKSHIQTFI